MSPKPLSNIEKLTRLLMKKPDISLDDAASKLDINVTSSQLYTARNRAAERKTELATANTATDNDKPPVNDFQDFGFTVEATENSGPISVDKDGVTIKGKQTDWSTVKTLANCVSVN